MATRRPESDLPRTVEKFDRWHAQDARFVTVHARIRSMTFDERVHWEGSLEPTGMGATRSLDEIYEGVAFDEPAADDA
jgi:hypothetical protein